MEKSKYVYANQIVFTVFFFQAEDGIRDLTVTGVQTCALPILKRLTAAAAVRRFTPGACPPSPPRRSPQIGRASCRERVQRQGIVTARTEKKQRYYACKTQHDEVSSCRILSRPNTMTAAHKHLT